MTDRPIIAACVALALAGCASAPDSIKPTDVSPSLYAGQTCSQMRAEAQRINTRLASLTGAQQRKANNDNTAMAVSLILFWPAAVFLAAGQDHAPEIAQLRGEAAALAQAAGARGC